MLCAVKLSLKQMKSISLAYQCKLAAFIFVLIRIDHTSEKFTTTAGLVGPLVLSSGNSEVSSLSFVWFPLSLLFVFFSPGWRSFSGPGQ